MSKKLDMAGTIQALLDVRALRRIKNARHKEQMDNLKKTEEMLSEWMKKLLEETGLDSAKTNAGTVFLRIDRYVKVDNWEEFQAVMKERGYEYMLNKAVNRSKVLEYYDTYGELPPGLSMNQVQSISVRKATK